MTWTALRPRRYRTVPVEKKLPGQREAPWVCTCPERKHYNRHLDPWQCRNEFTTSQRVLAWLKEEFGHASSSR